MTAPSTRTWYHTIDLPDGTATPGWFDTRAAPGPAGLAASLAGRRCLDVGTFDGFWAFEMERRGAAEVVALDLDDPTKLDWSYDERERGPALVEEWGTGAVQGSQRRLRRSALRSGESTARSTTSTPEVAGRFDLVLCGALLLHLKDPVTALERMRERLRRRAPSHRASRSLARAGRTPGAERPFRRRLGPVVAGQLCGSRGDDPTSGLRRHVGGQAVPRAVRSGRAVRAADAVASTPSPRASRAGNGLLFRALLARPRDPRPDPTRS